MHIRWTNYSRPKYCGEQRWNYEKKKSLSSREHKYCVVTTTQILLSRIGIYIHLRDSESIEAKVKTGIYIIKFIRPSLTSSRFIFFPSIPSILRFSEFEIYFFLDDEKKTRSNFRSVIFLIWNIWFWKNRRTRGK